MRYQCLIGLSLVVLAGGCVPPPTGSPAAGSGGSSATAQAPADSPPTETAQPTERVKAGVGVAAQGRGLDNESGILVQPAKSFFATKERLVFEVRLKQALDLYKATNGAPPKSHDEYMAQVVKANAIQLPKLPEGHKYVYDPQQGELLVERPQQ